MTTTITLAGVDVSSKLLAASMTAKFNTVDLSLLNQAVPALGATLVLTDPAWSGTVSATTSADVTLQGNSQTVVTLTATNANALPNDTAPFDISDAPAAFTDTYLLEDGSGNYLLESGTDFVNGTTDSYLMEGTLSYGCNYLNVTKSLTSGGPNQTLGRCTVVQPGLRPGNNFKLTSANQGYSSSAFQVTQVTTRWPALTTNPIFDIEFGDTPETLAAWTLANAVVTPPVLTPPLLFPAGTSIWGKFSVGPSKPAAGGGIVTLGSATFTLNPDVGHTLTCQVLGVLDAIAYAWDNYVSAPRRAVRAVLSGGIYTGTWQEYAGGWSGGSTVGYRSTMDLSSAAGISLPAGTYTVSIQIDTQEFNQLQIFSGWAQVAVIQT